MLDFLSTVDATKWQDSNIGLRQPGTGIWFTDSADFKSWLATDESKLWIYGIRELSHGINCNAANCVSWRWENCINVSHKYK